MSQFANPARANPALWSTKRLGIFSFNSPLDGMLVHRRVTPRIAQEHNTVFPARAQTRITRYGEKCPNHKTTAPQLPISKQFNNQWPIKRKGHVREIGFLYLIGLEGMSRLWLVGVSNVVFLNKKRKYVKTEKPMELCEILWRSTWL